MSQSNIQVLLIEANQTNVLLYTGLLKAWSRHTFDITHCDHLEQAMERLENNPFDAIVTSLHLPDEQGIPVVQRLTAHVSATPIIVLTELDDEGHARDAMQSGVQDYLIKETLSSGLFARALIYAIERKRLLEQIRYNANHDALTQLFNRQCLVENLETAVSSAIRYQHILSLCICDIDQFKDINDSFGHINGDKVLYNFGRIITEQLRTVDIAGRYGGDEFILVFPHTHAADSAICVERIRQRLAETDFKTNNGQIFHTSATFGMATLNQEIDNINGLLNAADMALYAAKQAGRNCIFQQNSELGHPERYNP